MAKTKEDVYKCEYCGAELKKSQIKMGKCPKCQHKITKDMMMKDDKEDMEMEDEE